MKQYGEHAEEPHSAADEGGCLLRTNWNEYQKGRVGLIA
jgi:hypothetical protein